MFMPIIFGYNIVKLDSMDNITFLAHQWMSIVLIVTSINLWKRVETFQLRIKSRNNDDV